MSGESFSMVGERGQNVLKLSNGKFVVEFSKEAWETILENYCSTSHADGTFPFPFFSFNWWFFEGSAGNEKGRSVESARWENYENWTFVGIEKRIQVAGDKFSALNGASHSHSQLCSFTWL